MICAHCSTPLPDDSRFCLQCGSLVSDAEGQARASATMDASSTARMERALKEDTKGEYEIDRQLGKGGMAAVYLATEIRLGRRVAIKVLPPELTFGHGIERFVREAKTAAALDHPNIIPIYRITSGDAVFWYAMKYIEGLSLDEMVKDKKLFSVEETTGILAQAAEALEYAHKKMVIHRDVKPANMMIDESGRVILTDFGIAKALTEGTLTASGAAIGTPYYMSPEQAMGGAVSGAADQYSLAVVAYQMLSGQLPFTGESAVEILHKHTVDDPPPLEMLRPGLPPHVYAAVARAMEKKAADRFASIRGFVNALQGLPPGDADRRSATLLVTQKKSAARPRPAPKRSMPRAAMVVLVVSVVGAAAGGGWLAWHRGQQRADARADSTRVSDSLAAAARPPVHDATQAERDSLAAAAAVAADTTPRGGAAGASATGRLSVRGLPRGGSLFVDGVRRTGSPDLRPGQHVVRLEAAGFAPFTDTVEVRAGQPARIAWVGTRVAIADQPQVVGPPAGLLGDRGILVVSVEPFANISVDLGPSVLKRTRTDTLSAASHRISVTKPGYVSVDTSVTVRAGEERRVRIVLRAQ